MSWRCTDMDPVLTHGRLQCFLAPDRKEMIITRKLSYDSADFNSDLISTTDTNSTHTKPLVYDRYLKQNGWKFELPSTNEEIRTETREGGTHSGFPDDDAHFQTIRRLLHDILTSAGRGIGVIHPVAVRATVKGWVQTGCYFKQLFDAKDGFEDSCPLYGDDDNGRKVHITGRVREIIATCIQEELQKLWNLVVRQRGVWTTSPNPDDQVLEDQTEIGRDEAAFLQHGVNEYHQREDLDFRPNEKRGFFPETATPDRSKPIDLNTSIDIDKTAGNSHLQITDFYQSESPKVLGSSWGSEHVSRYHSGINVSAIEDETTHVVEWGPKTCKRPALENEKRITVIGIPYAVTRTLEKPSAMPACPQPKRELSAGRSVERVVRYSWTRTRRSKVQDIV